MAVEASFALVQRSVFEANLAEPGAHILVAIETKFTARFYQNESVIRSMGSVTGCALALDHKLMSTTCIIWQHLSVATLTEFGAVCG